MILPPQLGGLDNHYHFRLPQGGAQEAPDRESLHGPAFPNQLQEQGLASKLKLEQNVSCRPLSMT